MAVRDVDRLPGIAHSYTPDKVSIYFDSDVPGRERVAVLKKVLAVMKAVGLGLEIPDGFKEKLLTEDITASAIEIPFPDLDDVQRRNIMLGIANAVIAVYREAHSMGRDLKPSVAMLDKGLDDGLRGEILSIVIADN